MSLREFRLPDLGEGVHEGQVLRLLVAEGDVVAEDQLLMEVETDKAAVEIPSPHAGRIARIHVQPNEIVNVGDVMITYGEGDATGGAAPTAKRAPQAAAASAAAPAPATSNDSAAPARRPAASPAVRNLARRLGVALAAIEGSGPGGRILRGDVERAAKAPAAVEVLARPAAPRSAPANRAAPPPPIAPPALEGTVDRDEHGEIVRTPIQLTRRRIAEVMTEAWRTIPHVTDCDDADVTDLDHLRRGHASGTPDARPLGMLAFVVRAVARALVLHPALNASWEGERGEIVHKRYVNIAIGMQGPRGLAAPVLRDADRKSIPELDAEIAALADLARAGRLQPESLAGATYTISNAGAMGGSRYATPIITPPQVAVLAVGRSRRLPWVVGDSIQPRLIMPLSHSMDHRAIDGAIEIAFMREVIGALEHPGRLLL